MHNSPWDEMSGISEDDLTTTDVNLPEEKETLEDSVKRMVSEVSQELRLVHSGRYDEKRAIKTAALALRAQMDLAIILSDVEGTARGAKNEVKATEAEVYLDHRSSSEKKMTEGALQQVTAKDKRTVTAEARAVKAEKIAKKWGIIFGTMKEAHIFFRTLGKNDWSI
jgi:hypothetical protein